MLPGKKRTEKILAAQQQSSGPVAQRSRIWRRFQKNTLARWSLRILMVLTLIALLSDFIANEKPIRCRIDGQTYWPVFQQYRVALGGRWSQKLLNYNWRQGNYESVWWPPIPYSSATLDLRNSNFRSPFGPQDVEGWHQWHWLGTDQLGRDVAAGMINGTRTAMSVGIIAMSVAAFIGILLGGIAGFFGDHGLRWSRARIACNILALVLAWFYGFAARADSFARADHFYFDLLLGIGIGLLIFLLFNVLASVCERLGILSGRVNIPLDLLVMRLIEVFSSVPGLLLLLALLAILPRATMLNVMLIIGLVAWPGIARFTRAEMLRIRSLDYIEAARSLGLSRRRIWWHHALPNALTPVLITIAFGIAAAILLEAFLSFLGLGIAVEEVTWGKLLSLARNHFSAWWLALFPGMAIFITVAIFNFIGEGLTESMGD